ncbi:unnamed protein product, partial [Staurois parvus]
MSEQYRYPPNDPFLQSRQSNVLHKKDGSFLKLYFFVIIFRKMKKIFFLHTVT